VSELNSSQQNRVLITGKSRRENVSVDFGCGSTDHQDPVAVILQPMKRLVLIVTAVLVCAPLAAADLPVVDGVSGAPLVWSEWVAKRGPVAVVVWASWAPGAESVIARYRELADASRDIGLELVVLDVQESLEDGRKALAGTEISWIHDRHGALLKHYRVIDVPSILVVGADGNLKQRLPAKAEALRAGWSG